MVFMNTPVHRKWVVSANKPPKSGCVPEHKNSLIAQHAFAMMCAYLTTAITACSPGARSRAGRVLRAPMALYSAPGPGVWDGPRAGLGWLGLVEIDVDRPRSRATDGHSVNDTRKISQK